MTFAKAPPRPKRPREEGEFSTFTPKPRPVAVSSVERAPAEAVPKMKLLRSPAYRRYVARQACFGCGIAGFSQAAHPNQAKYGKGRSIKSGDQYCFPLCATRPGHQGCHVVHDQCLDCSREENNAMEDDYVQRMQRIAREHGWFKDEVAA